MSAIDILKLQLDDFFERSNKETHTSIINKEKKYFNKSLFELEKHLYDLKKQYNVNQDIDCRISSTNILESFKKSPDFYRSDDYLLSFLVFFAIQKDHNADYLLEYMDKYFELVKDKLTFSDVITTATGATRCYTNLRFALNRLRNLGLIHSTTKENYKISRSLLPTPFGYLFAMHVSDLEEEDVTRLLENIYTNPSHNFYNLLHSFKINNEKFINNVILNAEDEDITEIFNSIRGNIMNISSNLKFDLNFSSEDIEKTEREMKEYYLNDEKQQEVSMRLRDLVCK